MGTDAFSKFDTTKRVRVLSVLDSYETTLSEHVSRMERLRHDTKDINS